jgi:hypothetical protein
MKTFWAPVAMSVFIGATMVMSQEAAPPAAKAAAKAVYWCEVCHKVALAPGDCDGAKMSAMRVLSIAEGHCKLCACPADCKCTVAVDDPAKCSCGKDAVSGNLRDLFVCEKDLVVSDKAGQCAVCEADLVQVKPKVSPPEPPAKKTEKPRKRPSKKGSGGA